MAEISFDVDYLARLARLQLGESEIEEFSEQLARVLEYIDKLSGLDVSDVEPTAHAVLLANVSRPDRVRPSLTHAEAMRNAPATLDGLFLVPKIVE